MLKNSKAKILPKIIKLVDLGYLGMNKIYSNTDLPIKKSKNYSLTDQDKEYNKTLAQMRIVAEHVNQIGRAHV